MPKCVQPFIFSLYSTSLSPTLSCSICYIFLCKNQGPDIIPITNASPSYSSSESNNPSKNRHHLHSLCLCMNYYFYSTFMRTAVVPVTWIFNTWLLTPYQCHWVQETPHAYVLENIFLQDVMSYHFIELFHF